MRRELITWSLVAALVLGAFGFTVLVLNNSVYSASGYVKSYLDALARQDAAGALEIIGDQPANDTSDTLLRRDAMGELTDIKLINDIELEGGVHKVTFSYLADGMAGRTAFEVRDDYLLFGLFPDWHFVTGPLSTMYVTVLGDARFSANGIDLVTPTPNDPAGYLVFTPGTYKLNHDTTYLDAAPVRVDVQEPGASVPTALMVQPNALMIQEVQERVNEGLDTCTTQEVLMPTGCPFGQSMGNRIITAPAWSITQYPEVSIRAGDRSGEWLVPATPGIAHLVVDVRSLFDGSVSTFDEDVPFTVSYAIGFLPGDELLITARYE